MYRDSRDEKVRDTGIPTWSGFKGEADTSVAQAESKLRLRDIIGTCSRWDKDPPPHPTNGGNQTQGRGETWQDMRHDPSQCQGWKRGQGLWNLDHKIMWPELLWLEPFSPHYHQQTPAEKLIWALAHILDQERWKKLQTHMRPVPGRGGSHPSQKGPIWAFCRWHNYWRRWTCKHSFTLSFSD